MSEQLDIHEYSRRLKALADAAKQKAAQAIIIPAANKLLANKKNTIQVEGKKTDGSQIGQYSTTPMYASPDQFVKKSAFKPGKKAFIATSQKLGRYNAKTKTFKGGKTTQNVVKEKMKTMYLVQGYKELREIQGRPVDKVNLTYSGDLLASYQLQPTPTGAVIGLTNELSAKIRDGLENGTKKKKGYGKIFYAQKEELELYNKDVTEAAKTFTLKFLNGNV